MNATTSEIMAIFPVKRRWDRREVGKILGSIAELFLVWDFPDAEGEKEREVLQSTLF